MKKCFGCFPGWIPAGLLFVIQPGLASGFSPHHPAIVAHRGAMHDRPENTMAAFLRAHELGADVIEVDVRSSKDGRLFVLHDARLDRTTDGIGRAPDLTWRELRLLDAGSWFGPSFEGEKIPSLGEVLRWAKDRTEVLLDLKETGADFTRLVADEIRRSGDPDRTVIGVRSPEQARDFRDVIPECRQLAFMRNPGLIEEFADAGVDYLRLWLRWLEADPDLMETARATGRKVMINGTVGEPEEAAKLIRFRPEWILIDDVPRLRESLAGLSASHPLPD